MILTIFLALFLPTYVTVFQSGEITYQVDKDSITVDGQLTYFTGYAFDSKLKLHSLFAANCRSREYIIKSERGETVNEVFTRTYKDPPITPAKNGTPAGAVLDYVCGPSKEEG